METLQLAPSSRRFSSALITPQLQVSGQIMDSPTMEVNGSTKSTLKPSHSHRLQAQDQSPQARLYA